MPGVPAAVAGVDTVRAERARILAELREHVGDLAAEAGRAIRAQIPAYRAAAAPTTAELRDQVLSHYVAKLDALARDRTPTIDDIPFVHKAAMRRARAGLALHDYINAYRIGHQVLWDAVVATAGHSPPAHEAALSLAAPLMRYCDLATAHAAHAYTEFRHHLGTEAAETHRALLDALLDGHLPDRGPALSAARAHGLDPGVRMVVLTAIPIDPDPNASPEPPAPYEPDASDTHAPTPYDPDAPYAVSAALAGTRVVDARTLAVVRQGEIVAIPTLGHTTDAPTLRTRLSTLCAHLDALRERLADDDIPLAIGVSTVVTDVSALPAAYREARAALDLLPSDGGVAALPRLSAFEYLALRADPTATHLVDPRVRTFIAEDRARGGVLIATIRAFAASDLNLRTTATRLQIHHNTAQYRLRRIAERTAHNPRHIEDLIALLVAISLTDPTLPPP
jgi:hypothetical protein